MFAASRQHHLKKTGVTANVGRDDFSKLSYYLRCATVCVGLDIIDDDLVDHKNASRLPEKRKDGILILASQLITPDVVVGKVFFPEQNGLCGRRNNEFYEISQVDTILAVDTSVVIGGQQTEVKKIMFFNEAWMKNNYYTPLKNQMSRIRRLTQKETPSRSSDDGGEALAKLLLLGLAAALSDDDDGATSNHCKHCRGLDGECGCSHGCPVKSETKCSKVHHCDHCKGFDARCVCEHGCPEGLYSKCHVIHSTVTCDGCMVSGIRGARYKCRTCYDYDLCEKCYNQGARKHDMTHGFDRIDRVGSESVRLEPRQRKPPSRREYSSTSTSKAEYDRPSPTAPKEPPVAVATPVFDEPSPSSGSAFSVGDLVKLQGLNAKDMNGVTAVVKQDTTLMGGDRVQVELKERQPGKLVCVKAKNLSKVVSFQKGQMVCLTGLSNKEMNGTTGVVESYISGTERVMVRIYEGKTVSIKPENLQLVADILD